MTEAALRAYLLGKLSDPEVAQLESRLIEDPDLFSQLEVAEDDLFDAFARGQLDADERRRFVQRFAQDSERRQFAKAFSQRTAPARVVPFPRRYWMPLAAAAVLLIAVYVFPWRSPEHAPAPATGAIAPVAAPPAPMATVLRVPLSLGTSRSASGATAVALDSKITAVDFGIRLNPADRYAVYAVSVRARDGNVVWSGNSLSASDENGDLILHASVPADRLSAGAYELSVRGGASASSLDDLGFLAIEVNRVP